MAMMRYVCTRGCCSSGSRADDRRTVAREAQAGIEERDADLAEYIAERIHGPQPFNGRCVRDGLQCTCNSDRCL